MKNIQQYCSVVDRMKPDPACKQAVMEKARRSGIALTRRGIFAGTAVAAALLALNIGLGSFLMNKVTEESLTANSETIEVTEAVPATTSADSRAEQIVTSAAQSVMTAAAGTQEKTAPERTVLTQTEPAVTEQTAQTTAQPKQDPVQPAAEVHPKDGQLSYMLIPADRPYTFAGYDAGEPIVCHALPGEQIKLQLKVWNDPGLTFFQVGYNVQTFDVRVEGSIGGYQNNVMCCGEWNIEREKDRFLCFRDLNIQKMREEPLPDGTVLSETTLIAPSKPGHYVIQKADEKDYPSEASVLSPSAGEQSPVHCEISGFEVIVDEEDYASFGEAKWLIDPETVTDGLMVSAETIVAHAGQKNVPVNVWVKGNRPFLDGSLVMYYDPALESLIPDEDLTNPIKSWENDRSGVGLEGTLLENIPRLSVRNSWRETLLKRIDVSFDTREYTADGMICNDETRTEIQGEGVLLRLYFDMPEECGRYRIYVKNATLFGYSCATVLQSSSNIVPADIIVVP